MATIITSKSVGQNIEINLTTSTGYWKYNHNGTDSNVFGNGSQTIEVLNANGEFTIISCLSNGTISGVFERIDIINAQLTSFNGSGLTSLAILNLNDNQLTSFDGTGLSSLTSLNLSGNPLTTFIGGDMGLITSLNFGSDSNGGWNITTLETFDGTGLTGLNELILSNNQLTSLDVTPMISLSQLNIGNNLITPQNWDSILSGLVGIGNEDGLLKIGTVQRTNASTADYNTLVSRNWDINGTFEIYTPPTFITSKAVGQTINIIAETTTGYWKYNHNGTDSSVFNQNDGQQSAEVLNENGEFTVISCDPAGSILGEGSANGVITYLALSNNQITTFNGNELSSLNALGLEDNQLTEFDGTGLSSLTTLVLTNNPLITFIGGEMSQINGLDFPNWNVTTLESFDGTGLSSLTELYLAGNQLTSLDVSAMTSLNLLSLNDSKNGISNPITATANNNILAQLVVNGITDGIFKTTGGRTSAGTAAYDTLILTGWAIEGADLPPTWYRFKASGTNWNGYSGIDGNQIVREIYQYQSNGFTYYDLLTTESIGDVYFTDGGDQILATQVTVTFNEFSSSGSIISGVGFGGALTGYGNSPLGNWGTLISGELPAIPARFEGDIPAGSIIFSDADTSITGSTLTLLTTPILLSLTLNGDVIDLTGMNSGGANGTAFDEHKNPPRSALGYFIDGEETTFSITWGELVEIPVARKLRVRGITQQN
jgi:Leucine-rich repeat (LRR) protein